MVWMARFKRCRGTDGHEMERFASIGAGFGAFETGNGAGFRRISARVEEWRQMRCRLVCAGAGARG